MFALALRMLDGHSVKHPKPKPRSVIVEDGFCIDIATGVVVRPHIELDQNTGAYQPIFYYNRSWRFCNLFWLYRVDIADQGVVLRLFERLERIWEDVKHTYKRSYFLTQKLILQEITKRMCIASTQPKVRPISDIKRYRAQIAIFESLWKLL